MRSAATSTRPGTCAPRRPAGRACGAGRGGARGRSACHGWLTSSYNTCRSVLGTARVPLGTIFSLFLEGFGKQEGTEQVTHTSVVQPVVRWLTGG